MRVHRHIPFLRQLGQPAHVIEMAVRQNNAFRSLPNVSIAACLIRQPPPRTPASTSTQGPFFSPTKYTFAITIGRYHTPGAISLKRLARAGSDLPLSLLLVPTC